MNNSEIFSFRCLRFGFIAILAACSVCSGCSNSSRHDHTGAGAEVAAPAQSQPNSPLSANDVSILFPAPTRSADFEKLIAVRDLTVQNLHDPAKRDPLWPDAAFQQFLAIAASPAAQVAGAKSRIGLPKQAQSMDAWFIAGIRIDPGAPGLSPDIRAQFGQSPEIRVILQPVTRNFFGAPKVHDIAAHLIFNFTLEKLDAPAQPGCLPRPAPDLAAFHAIVADLAAIRTKLRSGQLSAHQVSTDGVPLGVHPGLADPTTAANLRQEIKSFLEKHLSAQRLSAMAIAGLPAGESAPWIFLSMLKVPPGAVPALPNGGFVPVHGPTLDGNQFAQLLQRILKSPRVVPQPQTNNLNPITCKNAALSPATLPIAVRAGVSTATLFAHPAPPAEKIAEILALLADPAKSHFFNTDCVSCHTETRRAMELLKTKQFPGVAFAALPNGPWNVRNFGWSPSLLGPAHATVTRRTAAETAAVVAFLNSESPAR